MIISLNASDEQLQEVSLELQVEVFSELLRAHRRGHHLVIVPRNVAAWIAENVPLSSNDLALINKIGQDFTQTGGLTRNAEVYIRLSPQRMLLPSLRNCIDVGFREFLESSLAEKPYFLLEDGQNDGKIYRFIFDWIQKRNRYANLSYVPSHGGGTGTLRMLEQLIDERRVVAVALDSDRKSPFHPTPTIIRQHENKLSNANWPYGVVVCLPCREIENLIPVSALESLPCSVGKSATLAWLRQHEDADRNANVSITERVAMFFDLKLGADIETIGSISIREAREWWEARLGENPVVGLGSNVSSQVIASGKAMSNFREDIFRNGVIEFLEELFRTVIWFFIAAAPTRV